MKHKIVVAALAAVLLAMPALSQSAVWQVTVSGATVIRNVKLERLNGDSLVVTSAGVSRFIPTDAITELRLVRHGSFWKGFRKGAMAGGLLGMAGGALFSKPGGFIAKDPWVYRPVSAVGVGLSLGLLGGVIAGAGGALSGVDEVHDVSRMIPLEKAARIQYILDKDERK